MLWVTRHWTSCFFFSSRRRHTRWPRDWSSDVCSSDLDHRILHTSYRSLESCQLRIDVGVQPLREIAQSMTSIRGRIAPRTDLRSEERRVGKESRTQGSRSD